MDIYSKLKSVHFDFFSDNYLGINKPYHKMIDEN